MGISGTRSRSVYVENMNSDLSMFFRSLVSLFINIDLQYLKVGEDHESFKHGGYENRTFDEDVECHCSEPETISTRYGIFVFVFFECFFDRAV